MRWTLVSKASIYILDYYFMFISSEGRVVTLKLSIFFMVCKESVSITFLRYEEFKDCTQIFQSISKRGIENLWRISLEQVW